MTQRDSMHRCKVCKKLFRDEECILDKIDGLLCPDKCITPLPLTEYELPTND